MEHVTRSVSLAEEEAVDAGWRYCRSDSVLDMMEDAGAAGVIAGDIR